jgi:hypothetical protein
LEEGEGTGARLGPLVTLAPGRLDFRGWVAGIGNPVASVALGESDPEVEANGDSPEQAVARLMEKLG